MSWFAIAESARGAAADPHALAVADMAAEDDDDDESETRPGLIAEYRAGGVTARRIDTALSFVWGAGSPDPRLPPEKFSAAWTGEMRVLAAGKYRLHVYTAGDVQIQLGDRQVLAARRDEPGWVDSELLDLAHGEQPLKIEFATVGPAPRLGVYWSGVNFLREPLPARLLQHATADTPPNDFARGETLARSLRCAACHASEESSPPLPGPALDRLSGAVSRAWLIAWLSDPGKEPRNAGAGQKTSTRRMPHFDLSADDAALLADWLLGGEPVDFEGIHAAAAETPAKPEPPSKDKATPSKTPQSPQSPDAAQGQMLTRTLGCLACHTIGGLGANGPFGGGDLTEIAAKRPADFFGPWLRSPERLNSAHRMPVFELSEAELSHLATYLATLGKPTANENATTTETKSSTRAIVQLDAKRIAAAERLAAEHRCGACHELPGKQRASTLPRLAKLGRDTRWQRSCASALSAKKNQPAFALAASSPEALQTYYQQLASRGGASPALLLAERNCLACHARGEAQGLGPTLAHVTETDVSLAPRLAMLSPPSLNEVGDKLNDQALTDAIARRDPARRPWLSVRMPRFDLSQEQLTSLVQKLVNADRLPDLPADERAPLKGQESPPRTDYALAGSRLVTADGFGCTSCHKIGSSVPAKGAAGAASLAAQGPDLSLLGSRVRRPWFDRWVRNPGRIVPRIEMPAVQTPTPGVLADRLDDQLAAVWQVLDTPGFEPPPASALRVVRSKNQTGLVEPVNVLTDVLQLDKKRRMIKPLLIGLPNRHNILFDLEHGRLAGWYIGDTARQRTEGKTWFWEPAASAWLWPSSETAPGEQKLGGPGQDTRSDIILVRDGKPMLPLVQGQFVTEIDRIEYWPGTVRLFYRLRFAAPTPGDLPTVLEVMQSFSGSGSRHKTPIVDPSGEIIPPRSGFHRRIEIQGLADNEEVLITFEAPGAKFDDETKRIVWTAAGAKNTFERYRNGVGWKTHTFKKQTARDDDLEVTGWLLSSWPRGQASMQQYWITELTVDSYLTPATAPPKPIEPVKLHVVPGFEAIRLPLPGDFMPTGLAFASDGGLRATSLRGEVLGFVDSDGDGLADRREVIADGLAAPYGLHVNADSIDVVNKYGLLRLSKFDKSGAAQSIEILASGWGHTADYHDWAVGLTRDAEGRYYIALPCQQDKRSPAAAHLRGRGLRLTPREKTYTSIQKYGIEPFCSGLRFPMGLAQNRRGELFASDNQGNYNPFNELNHLQDGRDYGFVNALERSEPRRELTPPAIDIPHPWTLSVNGLCFLETPGGDEAADRKHFGPWAGQLVGCEYDTRRLVRMSLQKVAGEYQGAVYPLSRTPQPGEATFEGPVVCAIAPDGALFVGNLRDSGWGAGQNTGSIVQMRRSGELPPGIAEVRATADGFEIFFTQPVDAVRGADAANYQVSSYRRTSTPAYGGADEQRRTEKVTSVKLADDRRSARVLLENLRAGFVYEFHLKPLTAQRGEFFPDEAHYTLRRLVTEKD